MKVQVHIQLFDLIEVLSENLKPCEIRNLFMYRGRFMWVCVGHARPTVGRAGIAKRHRDNAIVTDRRVHFVFQNVRNRDHASVADRRFHFVFQNA